MVSFFFFLSFILFFLGGGGRGGGKFIVNNQPVNRLLMLRGGESTPSYFFLRFDFLPAKLTGVLTPTQLQPGNEEKVGKASLEGNMKRKRSCCFGYKECPYTNIR